MKVGEDEPQSKEIVDNEVEDQIEINVIIEAIFKFLIAKKKLYITILCRILVCIWFTVNVYKSSKLLFYVHLLLLYILKPLEL